jgi:opacity protein-like surface antigen
MIRFNRSALSFAAALSLSALLAAAPAQAAQVNKAEYKAGKDKIEADYKADKTACKPLTGNAQDVCQEEAKAKEKNARAALEFAYTGKQADEQKLLKVKADTAYDVAKEKCDDQTGNTKDVCVQQAKTTHTKALADLKMVKDVNSAAKESTDDKRDAEMKLAREKCDALSGDAKSSCLDTAKQQYSKR